MSSAQQLPAGKILVIDDDPVVLNTLSLALKNAGYRAFEAADAPTAFGLARRVRPDLIVLDIFFPPDVSQSGNSWDAFMIIDWFKRMGVLGDKPVIVISGAEPEKFRKRCLAGGVSAFFSKPINIREFIETVTQLLRDRANREAPKRKAGKAL